MLEFWVFIDHCNKPLKIQTIGVEIMNAVLGPYHNPLKQSHYYLH